MPDLPLVGTDFAGYRLRAVLGRGGMSIVYQAENPRLRNVNALKVLAPELASDEVFRTRFREESQIAAALNHPNVIPIHDFGSSDGLLYIAMRYVSGTDLRQLLTERGSLAPHVAVDLLEQAARALDAAHRRGLVHRDVKPGNLLIAQSGDDGDPDHVYLADFGITKYVGQRTGLTVAGMILGTIQYTSPEQIQDLAVLGPADQYSLGCVLYECLTGRAPFEKSSNEAVMWAHVNEFAAPPSLLRPDLPPALDDVFTRVLDKNPDDRYANCRAFIAAAREALEAVAATRPQRPQRPGRPGRPGQPATGARTNRTQAGSWTPATGASATGARGDFQPAPVPTQRQPTASVVLPGGGTRGRRVRGRRVRGRLPERATTRTALGLAALAILAAGGTAAGMLASQAGTVPTGSRLAAHSASPPPSTLLSTLGRTEEFTGMLKMSTCAQQAATLVQCTNPDPAIASVTFATYPSLATLYSKYQEIVANVTGKPFAASENTGVCSAIAPNPTGENTWNHSDQYSTKYTVAELASGEVSTDTAMGRVFCAQEPNGSAVMVWTQNSGDLLGYATGSDASHEQVWDWYYNIHHNIIFPGQPAMSGMSMSPTATSS